MLTFEREPEGSDQLSHWAAQDSGVPWKRKTWSNDHPYESKQVSSGILLSTLQDLKNRKEYV